jgi:hypothetical protein
MSVLNNFRCVHGAEYRHGEHKGCLKGTREAVLNGIELWARDFDKPPVYLLEGLAGTGKSVIAKTIAERLSTDGQLGASFFCSRDFEGRKNPQFIFPTLAAQFARNYAEFRSILVPLIQSNPGIAYESLSNQIEKLIVQPLKLSRIPTGTVVVIDALDELDEYKGGESASEILSVLGLVVSEIPSVKFFITSRPGVDIGLPSGLAEVFTLHSVEPRTVNNDIRRFFEHELSGCAHRRGRVDRWPTDEHLDLLCRRAAGFFLYAVATVSFLDDRHHHPRDQLDLIIQSPESTTYEGKAELKGYTSLDSLYTSILQTALIKNSSLDADIVRSILSTVVLAAHPISYSSVAMLMSSDRENVNYILELTTPSYPTFSIQSFHKSFSDFITDPTRCTDPRFYVSPNYHTELLLRCFELMDKYLKENMRWTPDYALNYELDGFLPEGVESGDIRDGLEYVCKSWHKHLITTEDRAADIISALRHFLEQKFLFWLEVLSFLDAMDDATRALSTTVKWLNEVCLDRQLDR